MRKLLRVRGSIDQRTLDRIQAKFPRTKLLTFRDLNLGFEGSQQVEHANQVDAVQSLFVVKPRQTGYYATAQLAQQVLTDPGRTVALIDMPPNPTIDEEQDLQQLAEFLVDNGARVTQDIDDLDQLFIEDQ